SYLQRCSYCVEARSTYSDCFDDVIECAYRDPSSLIFCLNVYEHASASMIHYSARCLSYEKFYVPDETIKKIGASGMCKFADVQPCECDVCITQQTTTVSTITTMKNGKKHHHYRSRQVNESRHSKNLPNDSPSENDFSNIDENLTVSVTSEKNSAQTVTVTVPLCVLTFLFKNSIDCI
ncbi:hypothetical protein DICVIV_13112, partial [Dictyocaulus viviparus]